MKTAKNLEHFADSAALSEPHELLSAIFRSSLVGVAICDSQLRFLAVNKSLARMNRLAPRAHLGKTIRDVLGHAAVALEPPLKHVFSSGHKILGLEVSAKLPTRSEVGCWIEDYFPIRDRTGTVKQVAAVAVEVTEQRKLQQLLRRVTDGLTAALHDSNVLLPQIMGQVPDALADHNRSAVVGSSETLERRSQRNVNAKLSAVSLTPRECEIVKFLAGGHGNKQTAAMLGISVKTVETHRATIMLKLGLHSTAELLHYALSSKLLDPENIPRIR